MPHSMQLNEVRLQDVASSGRRPHDQCPDMSVCLRDGKVAGPDRASRPKPLGSFEGAGLRVDDARVDRGIEGTIGTQVVFLPDRPRSARDAEHRSLRTPLGAVECSVPDQPPGVLVADRHAKWPPVTRAFVHCLDDVRAASYWTRDLWAGAKPRERNAIGTPVT